VFNQNTPVDTRVAILEEKFSVYEQMMSKMESAIHTISEAYQGVSKMLAIHEQRIDTSNNADSTILETIKDLEKRNTEDHKEVILKIQKIEEKIESNIKELKEEFEEKENTQNSKIEGLIKFRWLIGGAILIIGFIFTQQQVQFFEFLPPQEPPAKILPSK
jgi:chromosome segregation ATPase